MKIDNFENKAAAEMLAGYELLQAIAIDTSVYDGLKGNFEGRLLKQLEQFARKEPVELLMPEVVYEETLRHAVARATESARDLKKTLKEAVFGLGLVRDEEERVLGVALGGQQPKDVAKRRFDSFIDSTGTTILSPSGLVNAAELQRRYFDAEAPFSQNGDKKAEFPDAIALLSLEGWAEMHNKHVLVVSHDNDWKCFCAGSRRLHVVGDLGHAIGLFQHATAASNFANSLDEWVGANADWARVEAALEDALWGMSITVDANSDYSFDEEVIDRSLLGLKLGAEPPIVLAASAHVWVIEVSVTADIEIEVGFSFSLRDGIDRDYIPFGSARVDATQELESRVILSFLPPDQDNPAPRLDDVEVTANFIYVECGYVRPSM